jgi:hypothetical protein
MHIPYTWACRKRERGGAWDEMREREERGHRLCSIFFIDGLL